MAELDIVSRARWAAQYRGGDGAAALPAREVWLHHSATTAPPASASLELDTIAVRLLEEIGHARFGAGISYTFVIPPSGRIFEGHGIARRGTHTGGRNSTSRGICLLGNYEATEPTRAQVDAVAALLVHGARAGWWARAALAGGHRDVKATACPGGRAYALIPEMNRRAGGAGPAPTTASPVAILRLGSRGPAVERLQRVLNAWYPRDLVPPLVVDGIYGPATAAAVRLCQQRAGLPVDGVVGSRTRAVLNL
jgi:hypothetical protein